MFNSIYKFIPMLLLVCGLMATPAFAAKLPSGYPDIKDYENLGTVDSIEKSKSRIVVNDQEYILPIGVVVHTPRKKIGSLRDVRKGNKVGVIADSGSKISLPSITAIWVLPRNFSIDADTRNQE